ncbi:MAG: hypothetical protein C0465_17800 [Ralstonia sp.]|uniref:hypothetical protein n=1 Tax=Ralstonia sp. TaxID=54061 RepID=UPI00257F5DB9|nr:hypothetical protein [Ralstonia sp.]MBA4232455.1 hypothetical protein [Ralstonia sp.]
MSQPFKTFEVVITDTVRYTVRIEAASEDAATIEAWHLFEVGDRDIHFADRCELNALAEEVRP